MFSNGKSAVSSVASIAIKRFTPLLDACMLRFLTKLSFKPFTNFWRFNMFLCKKFYNIRWIWTSDIIISCCKKNSFDIVHQVRHWSFFYYFAYLSINRCLRQHFPTPRDLWRCVLGHEWCITFPLCIFHCITILSFDQLPFYLLSYLRY